MGVEDLPEQGEHRLVCLATFGRCCDPDTQRTIVDADHLGPPCSGNNPDVDDGVGAVGSQSCFHVCPADHSSILGTGSANCELHSYEVGSLEWAARPIRPGPGTMKYDDLRPQ